MIKLIKEKHKNYTDYWLTKDDVVTQRFIGIIDKCSKQELISLARRINKEFGIPDWKEEMEKDKDWYFGRGTNEKIIKNNSKNKNDNRK